MRYDKPVADDAGVQDDRFRPTRFNPFVRFQWVNRLTMSRMSVGPLFPVGLPGRLVQQSSNTAGDSQVRKANRDRKQKTTFRHRIASV